MEETYHDGFAEIEANFSHIKVAVRCRPSLKIETERLPKIIVNVENDQVIVFHPESDEGLAYKSDHVFSEYTTQEQLYEETCVPAIQAFLNGYSCSVIPFGSADTGKTFTLFGTEDAMGMIPRFINDLFDQLEHFPPSVQHTITVTYFEMNNDHVVDLLDSDQLSLNMATDKRIRHSKEDGFFIQGIAHRMVTSAAELEYVIAFGNRQRQMLAESRGVRWHGFITLHMTSQDHENPESITHNSFTFVHLKGSERVGQEGVRGKLLKEGINVNKSVTALNDLIYELAITKRHTDKEITSAKAAATATATMGGSSSSTTSPRAEGAAPFRKSKFTNFMQNAFGGNSCTYFVACVAPTALTYFETMDTMETARIARRIRTQPRVRRQTTKYGEALKKLEELKAKLRPSTLADGHPLTEQEEEVERLEALLDSLRMGGEEPETGSELDVINEMANADSFPIDLPSSGMPLWRTHDTLALKHGYRKTVYIPAPDSKKIEYTGSWASNTKTGKGKMVTDKIIYDGEWSNDKRHGEGTLYAKKKDGKSTRRVYFGEWAFDKREGFGVNFYENGEEYEGEWRNGKRHGMGTQYYIDGSKYHGNWEEDKRCGFGTLYLVNGDRYQGMWYNDKKHGPGMYIYIRRGQVYQGQWFEDVAKCGTFMADDSWAHLDESEKPRPLPKLKLKDADVVLRTEVEKLAALSPEQPLATPASSVC